MKYYYSVDEKDRDHAYEYDGKDDLWPVAAMAEEYYSEHDGWYDGWPIMFHVWDESEYLGEYEVSIEYEPLFYAEKVKKDKSA